MSYTTEQLLEFLDQELRATWKGERVVLSSADRLNNPVISKAIGADKLSKVFAIQDFRAQIHAYQHQHGVSGLVWHTCRFGDRSIRCPELHPQLIAIPADKAALVAARQAVMAFWRQSIEGLCLWVAGSQPQPTTLAAVETLAATSEWAELAATRTELYLSLCWGDPKDCHCDWARPESGCDRIIATAGEPSGIKV
ncbi:hypothetical protein IQ254_21680 [Nodosilinea sp. LEGE 07088]|uniref:hypothetical protein n=1 Tax=Nodosilinea sp. LEGE 07088 TaxID=2777968 RepID=UPI001881DED2|nr:hypothetical protein [Nodosilinea sp. LEGE 07088]MBE9139774.1 hypothetical protein [Nodosilinea sp. LEGE 07088]